jgi:hypothetical protein
MRHEWVVVCVQYHHTPGPQAKVIRPVMSLRREFGGETHTARQFGAGLRGHRRVKVLEPEGAGCSEADTQAPRKEFIVGLRSLRRLIGEHAWE